MYTKENRFMNRSKTATHTPYNIKSLALFAMMGFLFTTGVQAADHGSAEKLWMEAHKQWVQAEKELCAPAAKKKNPEVCAAVQADLAQNERSMADLGITHTTHSQKLSESQDEGSNDPKVLHKIIQELKAKNKALKAQVSTQSCSSAGSLSEKSIKKSSGLSRGSALGEQQGDEDADTVNFSNRSSRGHSLK
jgi:hypothetical protein